MSTFRYSIFRYLRDDILYSCFDIFNDEVLFPYLSRTSDVEREEERDKILKKLRKSYRKTGKSIIDILHNDISPTARIYGFKKRGKILRNIRTNVRNMEHKLIKNNYDALTRSYVNFFKLYALPESKAYNKSFHDIIRDQNVDDINIIILINQIANRSLDNNFKIIRQLKRIANSHLKCFHCGGGVVIDRAQTRSCDEAETIFYECVECKNKF